METLNKVTNIDCTRMEANLYSDMCDAEISNQKLTNLISDHRALIQGNPRQRKKATRKYKYMNISKSQLLNYLDKEIKRSKIKLMLAGTPYEPPKSFAKWSINEFKWITGIK